MLDKINFRKFGVTDLDMVAEWLKSPDVALWYQDADYVDDLEEQLEDSRINQQIVLNGEVPFAYVQDYDIHGWNDHHLSFLPRGARGLDTFIGPPEMLGKGLGTLYLQAITDWLFANKVPALGIDPDPNNKRAIRAYQNVGFRGKDEIETEWGSVRLLSLSNKSNPS